MQMVSVGLAFEPPRDASKLVMLAEQRGAAIEMGDECRSSAEDLPDRCFAVRTDDRGLDAETLQVGQQRRYAGEQRYPGGGGELAPPHVADDGGQLPDRHLQPRHDLPRRQPAQSLQFVGARPARGRTARPCPGRRRGTRAGSWQGCRRSRRWRGDSGSCGVDRHGFTGRCRRNSPACRWSRSRPRAGRHRRPSAFRR